MFFVKALQINIISKVFEHKKEGAIKGKFTILAAAICLPERCSDIVPGKRKAMRPGVRPADGAILLTRPIRAGSGQLAEL